MTTTTTTTKHMTLITRIKETFVKRRTLASLAEEQLVEEQRKLLEAQSGLEFAQAAVLQRSATIRRLRHILENNSLVERGDLVT